MTEAQFEKMYALEVAKLAALQGIYSVLVGIAVKQGAGGGVNWANVAELLKQGEAVAERAGAGAKD